MASPRGILGPRVIAYLMECGEVHGESKGWRGREGEKEGREKMKAGEHRRHEGKSRYTWELKDGTK